MNACLLQHQSPELSLLCFYMFLGATVHTDTRGLNTRNQGTAGASQRSRLPQDTAGVGGSGQLEPEAGCVQAQHVPGLPLQSLVLPPCIPLWGPEADAAD